MDRSMYIGIALCIFSAAIGSAIQIAIGVGMITQANAIYYLIGTGVLFLVGVGFLVRGFILKPKGMPLVSTINHSKATNPSTHKLFHSIICEIVGAGMLVWGTYIATNGSTDNYMSSAIGMILILLGLGVFATGVGIGVSK